MFRTLLLLLELLIVLCRSTQAGPVTLDLGAFERLSIESMLPGSSSKAQFPDEPVEDRLNLCQQNVGLASRSTTGVPSRSLTLGGTSAAAPTSLTMVSRSSLTAVLINRSGVLFLPPPVVDGIFRPPRYVVSP